MSGIFLEEKVGNNKIEDLHNNMTHRLIQNQSYGNLSRKFDINLPKIRLKLQKTPRGTVQSSSPLSLLLTQQTEEVTKLDEWSNSLPVVKRKRNQTSESIAFLYKANSKYSSYNSSKFKQNSNPEIGPAVLYLAQLDNQLAKIKKINYHAIYQNVEYCTGVYEIAFNDILKKLDGFRVMLQEAIELRLKNIEEFRQLKIEQMKAYRQLNLRLKQDSKSESIDHEKHGSQKSMVNNNEGKKKSLYNIASTSRFPGISDEIVRNYVDLKQIIEVKNNQLKPIKKVLEKIQKQRIKVLNFSLQLGYDIRQEGLVWILKQFNCPHNTSLYITDDTKQSKPQPDKPPQKYIPKLSEFPTFLTEQQINFIISKFNNNFKLKDISEQKQIKQEEQKEILHQAYQSVRKQRNRKLSMIKEKELLAKLLAQKKQSIASGHKYINNEIVSMMQNHQKLKCTTNELIYQETLRKLNRFCIQQIHCKKDSKEKENQKRGEKGERVNKLMEGIKTMLADVYKLKLKEESIKTAQEKELSDILMKLRSEIYEGRFVCEKRNPISVLGCLVGWKKAKKILENEMNISMPASGV